MQEMKQLFDSLEALLVQMDGVAEELEAIIQREREAVREIDATMLVVLGERRAMCQQIMSTLQKEVRTLLMNGGAQETMSIEAFIDVYAGVDAERFQSLRRALYERMSQIEHKNTENYVRMHAAYDVTHSILRQIGLVKSEQTYSVGNAR